MCITIDRMLAVTVFLALGAHQAKADYACDASYVLFEKYCYRVSKDADIYNYALADCIAEGAHLVSIHSASANAFIRSLSKDEVLIGLQYQTDTKTYNWSDSSSLDYKNYTTNFETYKEFFGYCAKMDTTGKWANAECELDELKYVCKKQAVSQSLTNSSICPDENVLYSESGELTSPGYPGKYDGSGTLDCSYKLMAKNGYFINIIVEEANVGSDHIYVYRTHSSAKTNLVTTVTRTLYNVSTLIRTNLVLVVFSGKGNGVWKIRWDSIETEATCEQPWYSTERRIDDWCYFYPFHAANARINYCEAQCLNHLEGDVISIHSQTEENLLTSMAVPNYPSQIIGLEYYGNGQWKWMDESPFDYTNFANNYVPTTDASYQIYSLQGSWISAKADNYNYQVNCQKRASVVPLTPKGCQDSNIIFETSGELFSPGFPAKYADSDLFGCKIHLRAKTGYNIYLYMSARDSSQQVLTVYNGWKETNDHILGVYQSNSHQLLATSNGTNTVLIVHDALQSAWWTVSWYSTKDPAYIPAMQQAPIINFIEEDMDAWNILEVKSVDCPNTVMTVYGNQKHIAITSPDYPSGYPANEDCVYYSNSTGTLPSGHYWRIIFMRLNIGHDDYIKLVDLRTNTIFATTDTIIRESLVLATDFEFAIEFHGGSVQSNHELWRIVQHYYPE